MRASKYPIADKIEPARQHLHRSASLLDTRVSQSLLMTPCVTESIPHLIALDAIELGRVTDFRASPWYSGNDLHSALKSDPMEATGSCSALLARTLHEQIASGHARDVVLADSLAMHDDACLNDRRDRLIYCGQRVYYPVRFHTDDAEWFIDFDNAMRSASNAAECMIGWCTTVATPINCQWTAMQLDEMIMAASCVFATALDGEGFLVWENPLAGGR